MGVNETGNFMRRKMAAPLFRGLPPKSRKRQQATAGSVTNNKPMNIALKAQIRIARTEPSDIYLLDEFLADDVL